MFLEWVEANASTIGIICSIIIGLCSAIAAVASMFKAINTGKVNAANYNELKNQIVITKEGIVNAFEQAKFPTNWRIDLSKKVEAKFDELSNKLYDRLTKSDEAKTKLMIYLAKIISNTAAYNKLTDEEKADLTSLLTIVNELEIE
jgi:hypothetical protein